MTGIRWTHTRSSASAIPEDKEEMERVWQFLQDFNTRITKLGCTQYLLGDVMPIVTAQDLGPLYDFMLR